MGLSGCYDLRFLELYRSLTKRGTRIIFMYPSSPPLPARPLGAAAPRLRIEN